MDFIAKAADLDDILPWRDIYRLEMSCQIIYDSIHGRPGWTREYLLCAGDAVAGYGSLAVAGPWTDKPTLYEFFVLPGYRLNVFALFQSLLDASGAVMIECQSNASLITAMLYTFARDVATESILFEDKITTSHSPAGAVFRGATSAEEPDVPADRLKWLGIVEVEGQAAAKGGVLFHYNKPYGDIWMETAEPFRRRGLGSYVVQELKRICYQGGKVPAARCNPQNVASRLTLQKAGFVPCGQILHGSVPR